MTDTRNSSRASAVGPLPQPVEDRASERLSPSTRVDGKFRSFPWRIGRSGLAQAQDQRSVQDSAESPLRTLVVGTASRLQFGSFERSTVAPRRITCEILLVLVMSSTGFASSTIK